MFHNTLLKVVFLIVCISIRCARCQLFYWVDNSCNAKGDFRTALDEAFVGSKKAAERLQSESDKDFAAVFERIFATPKSDTNTYNMVFRKFEELWCCPPDPWLIPNVQKLFTR